MASKGGSLGSLQMLPQTQRAVKPLLHIACYSAFQVCQAWDLACSEPTALFPMVAEPSGTVIPA